MANRYGRDIGRRDREGFGNNEERDRSHYPRSESGFGSSPFGEDESYFGGSRRFGQGYQGDSPRNFDTSGGGDFGRSSGGYTERESWSGGEDDRYSQGNERSQGWGRGGRQGYSGGGHSGESEYRGGYARSDRPDRDYQTGSGYSGFSERGGSRGSSGSGGYGNYGGGYSGSGGFSGYEDRDRGRNWGSGSNYGSGNPSSERGYTSGGYNEGDRDDRGWLERASDEVSSWFSGDDDTSRRSGTSMRQGGHRGRGPSGYTRSDDRIREDINDRLTDYDYLDATHINVEVQGGEVILTGTVESRYEKRLAEDIAEDCSGVRNVENRLRISQNTSAYGQQGTTSSYSSDTQSTSGTTEAPGSINRTSTESTTSGSTDMSATGGTTATGQKARGKSSSGS